jgi:hypothetical protein
VEEPGKVVGDDEEARGEKGGGSEGDEGPCGRKVLEVDDVAENGEEDGQQREAVCKVEETVEDYDGLGK